MLAPLGNVDPDEVIAVLPPRSGEATRRTIAINAALAGCRPEHLPVLVSAVRALAHPDLNLRGVNATTHPVAPLLIVHGQAVGARRVQLLGSAPSDPGTGPTPRSGARSG